MYYPCKQVSNKIHTHIGTHTELVQYTHRISAISKGVRFNMELAKTKEFQSIHTIVKT